MAKFNTTFSREPLRRVVPPAMDAPPGTQVRFSTGPLMHASVTPLDARTWRRGTISHAVFGGFVVLPEETPGGADRSPITVDRAKVCLVPTSDNLRYYFVERLNSIPTDLSPLTIAPRVQGLWEDAARVAVAWGGDLLAVGGFTLPRPPDTYRPPNCLMPLCEERDPALFSDADAGEYWCPDCDIAMPEEECACGRER